MTYLSIFVVFVVVFVVVFPFFGALKDLQITEELQRFANFVILYIYKNK